MKSVIKYVLFGLLLVVSTAQAEDTTHWSNVNDVLEHNHRLLTYTTIGINLKDSTDQEVIKLYELANDLLEEAQVAYTLKNFATAKELSIESIRTVYQADRVLYGLVGLN